MTTKLSRMDKAISDYKTLGAKVRDIEAQKALLKAIITDELGTETRYIGPRGSVAKFIMVQRHTNFDLAKERLEADVYYEIISETPAESLRVS